MAEYISRDALEKWLLAGMASLDSEADRKYVVERLREEIPAADVRPVVKAKWEDVHIDRPEIADIEVATMFCPHCNRWHNEVYHYGNPIEFANYCSFCGASMKEAT